MKWRPFSLFLVFLFSVLASFGISTTVNASSAYDSMPAPYDTDIAWAMTGACSGTFGNPWHFWTSVPLAEDRFNPSQDYSPYDDWEDMLLDLDSVLDTGSRDFLVTINETSSSTPRTTNNVTIYWAANSGSELTGFDPVNAGSDYWFQADFSGAYHQLNISCSGSGNTQIYNEVSFNNPASPVFFVGDLSSSVGSYFLVRPVAWKLTDTIAYPSGYEGVEFDQEQLPQPPADAWSPEIRIITVAGYVVRWHDIQFETIDPVPFLCNDSTAPVITYEIQDSGTSTVVDSGTFSATIQTESQLPMFASSYTIYAWYDCDTEGDGLDFSTPDTLSFAVNEYGTQDVECLSTSFSDWYCSLGQALSIGVLSTTLNGLLGTLYVFAGISPTTCSLAWANSLAPPAEYDVGDMSTLPSRICDFAGDFWLDESTPFHYVKVTLNILLAGAAVLFMVFAVLSLLGIRVAVPSPGIGDDEPDPSIPTHPSVSRHKTSYVKGSSSGSIGTTGYGSFERARRRKR